MIQGGRSDSDAEVALGGEAGAGSVRRAGVFGDDRILSYLRYFPDGTSIADQQAVIEQGELPGDAVLIDEAEDGTCDLALYSSEALREAQGDFSNIVVTRDEEFPSSVTLSLTGDETLDETFC